MSKQPELAASCGVFNSKRNKLIIRCNHDVYCGNEFFDERNGLPGYVLGVDSRVGVLGDAGDLNNQLDVKDTFEGAKHFAGKRYLGLFSGGVVVPVDKGLTADWETAMRELGGSTFDEIKPNQEFDNLPLMAHEGRNVALIIAQRFRQGVALYNVRQTNPNTNALTAKLLHQANRASREKGRSKVWYGPIDVEMQKIDLGERLGLRDAQLRLHGFVRSEAVEMRMGHRPSGFHIYYISPEEHGEINDGVLVPIA